MFLPRYYSIDFFEFVDIKTIDVVINSILCERENWNLMLPQNDIL